jgi:hypothetical protein
MPTNEDTLLLLLTQKLLRIKESVSVIKKDATNKHQGFDYVSSTAVLSRLRDEMNKQRVLLVPSVTGADTEVRGKQLLTKANMIFRWVSVDDPNDFIECPWYSQGADMGDKGPAKCYTSGEKYFLLKFFNIPTDGVDSDADAPPDNSAARPRNDAVKPRNASAPDPEPPPRYDGDDDIPFDVPGQNLPQPNMRQYDNDGPKMASDKQLKFIVSLLPEAWPHLPEMQQLDELRILCRECDYPTKSEELTSGQASTLIKSLQGLAKAQRGES